MFIISTGTSHYFINKVYFEAFSLIQVSTLLLSMKYLMHNDLEVIWPKIEKNLSNQVFGVNKQLVHVHLNIQV